MRYQPASPFHEPVESHNGTTLGVTGGITDADTFLDADFDDVEEDQLDGVLTGGKGTLIQGIH